MILGFLVCSVLSFFVWNTTRTAPSGVWNVMLRLGIQIFFQIELALIAWFAFDISGFALLFCAVCSWYVEHLASCLCTVLSSIFSIEGSYYPNYTWAFFALTIGIYAFIYGGMFLLSYKKRGIEPDSAKTYILIISLVSGISIFLFQFFYNVYGMTERAIEAVKLYETVLCVVCLALAFSILDTNRVKRELDFLDKLDQQRMEQYKISKETVDLLNTRCHDLKKYCIDGNNPMNEEEKNLLLESLLTYESIVQTGNPALDLILTEKSLFCRNNGIKLDIVISSYHVDFLSDMDIYSIFGNLLDNAIEAVEKLEEQRRIISFSVKGNDRMLVIHEDNLTDETFSEKRKTSKSDEVNHGYGLLSIRRVIEKYDGGMTVQVKDGVFRLDILIPIPQEKTAR